MTFDASQAFRYAMDFTLAQTSVLGVTPYQVYLIQIDNDLVNFDDTTTNKQVTTTRILIADGYRNYAALDGYLNPIVTQENGENLVLSNGQIVANTIVVGPIVFPYTQNGFSGGTDAQIFQPPIGTNNNLQIYLQIQGVALSPSGNFFQVKEMKIAGMSGLSYQLVCTATVTNPNINV
jgi:hypothetical protein